MTAGRVHHHARGSEGTIDCGIAVLPCCLPPWFHKFATPKVFLLALVLLGICQGSVQAYFAATVPHITEIFEYPTVVTEWLLVSHDLFLGLFGLFVAHCGVRIHRAAWLGGLACLQGACCMLVMVPYLVHDTSSPGVVRPAEPNLCKEVRHSNLEIVSDDHGNCLITLIVLFVLQLLIGLGNASFYSHGFSYLDDNVKKKNSPFYLSILIAIRMSSVQFGSFMAWSFLSQERSWWIGYPIIGSLLLITGTIVVNFPRNLLSIVMDQTVATILENVRGNSTGDLTEGESTSKPDTGFWASFKRVATNKIVIVNTLSSVFLYMAVDNFSSYEPKYMESEFYIPVAGEGFQDPWISRLVKNIFEFPVIGLCILLSGLAIAKFKPRTTRLATWNVITSLIVAFVFISFAFISCDKGKLAEENRNNLPNPFCSRFCNCAVTSTKFEPVCTNDGRGTYFSPCYAGCSQSTYPGYYSNCTCSSFYTNGFYSNPAAAVATEGACDNAQCALHWKVFQILSVFSAALLGTGYVGNLLITLRAVLPTDKAMAIAFEICMAGILVHVPGKILYDIIAGKTCYYRSYDGQSCSLHGEKFGEILTLLTASLIFVSIFMDIMVVYLTRDLQLFDDDYYEPKTPVQPYMGGFSYDPPLSEVSTLDRRPPRPRSARYSSVEMEPLTSGVRQERPNSRRSLGPQGSDGRPLSTADAQRDVIEEFKQRRSTRI